MDSFSSTSTLSDFTATATDLPVFQKDKHIAYWLRCLRTPLPHQYTSNDANRMFLAYFTLSALDLLGVLHERTTDSERSEYAEWIYSCQHPNGGFRSCPAMNFGGGACSDSDVLDPASVPATFFALASLAVLRDDLSRVHKSDCFLWLFKMQRPDGSFGEMLGENGKIEGGIDTRFAHCASGIRWILRHTPNPTDGVPDIDVEGLVRCIDSFTTYDGGISQGPFNEGHAGLTYCALGALSFMGRLPRSGLSTSNDEPGVLGMDFRQPEEVLADDTTIRWLLSRLTTDIEDDESDDEDAQSIARPTSSLEENSDSYGPSLKLSGHPIHEHTGNLSSSPKSRAQFLTPVDMLSVNWVGFNGRSNKLADTCYVFWAGAALAILRCLHLTPTLLIRNYLLERTQHLVMGGFGKLPGALPDIYHAYLGLAALSLLTSSNSGLEESSQPSIKPLDPALCVSRDARLWIEGLSGARHGNLT